VFTLLPVNVVTTMFVTLITTSAHLTLFAPPLLGLRTYKMLLEYPAKLMATVVVMDTSVPTLVTLQLSHKWLRTGIFLHPNSQEESKPLLIRLGFTVTLPRRLWLTPLVFVSVLLLRIWQVGLTTTLRIQNVAGLIPIANLKCIKVPPRLVGMVMAITCAQTLAEICVVKLLPVILCPINAKLLLIHLHPATPISTQVVLHAPPLFAATMRQHGPAEFQVMPVALKNLLARLEVHITPIVN